MMPYRLCVHPWKRTTPMKRLFRKRVLLLCFGRCMTSSAFRTVAVVVVELVRPGRGPQRRYNSNRSVGTWQLLSPRENQQTLTNHASLHHRHHSCLLATPPQPNESTWSRKYNELMEASTLSLAPMMDYTDRHFRHLVRLLSSRTLVYTEMVAANAIAHERRNSIEAFMSEQRTCASETGDGDDDGNGNVDTSVAGKHYNDDFLQRYLGQAQHPREDGRFEGPSVLQLGGSDPQLLYEAAQTVLEMTERGHCHYTALNLNCGCPSPKVAGKGCFGAALMDEPEKVALLTTALSQGTSGTLPVTVKCRIGTDSDQAFSKLVPLDMERQYDTLCRFIDTVASPGVVTDFAVHARIAVLQRSFSPADNRNVPPLQYELVRRLVTDFPHLTFTLNGGITSIAQAQAELEAAPGLKGIMVGRAWAADPWSFAMTDQLLYGESAAPTEARKNRLQILEAYGRHADREEANGEPDKIRRFIVKAISPLFAGEPNAKRYRIALDEVAGLPKKMKMQGKSMVGQPPLSELILGAALKHLDMETLLRTPEESYERLLLAERQRSSRSDASPSNASVQEWQALRKEAMALDAQSYEDIAAGQM
jgi:tRNA-dihydrouridine synthase A